MPLADPRTSALPFDNSYARLPERFYTRLDPSPVPEPRLLKLNHALAVELGLDPAWLSPDDGVAMLAGTRVPDGAEPLAMAYAGHQFGGWVPQLGDGRAILLGEVVDAAGRRRDIQLKGSGRTPYSRMGDGRAVLGPVLREYIIGEAMAALGVPTTRALAAIATGQQILRERLLPGAILTRVASSHIRVGTFQFLAARNDVEGLRALADHVIARHDPEARDNTAPYRAMFDAIIARQADLVACWMHIGFIHGVMNTDNMSVAGETIDYGPCAFMDSYDPETVFSSIDQTGRYAFGNQPRIAHWNLACLAQAILPLIDPNEEAAVEQAKDSLDGFSGRFNAAFSTGLLSKIGLVDQQDGDLDLVQDLLVRMAEERADFTLTFRRLAAVADPDLTAEADAPIRDLFQDGAAFDGWTAAWRARLAQDSQVVEDRQSAMRSVNPAVIPRNHLVEEALAAAYDDDLTPFNTLLDVLATPFEDPSADQARYTLPPRPEEVVRATFCGT